MSHLQILNEQIIQYNLQFQKFDVTTLGWKVGKSQIAGKGLLATKRFNPRDTVFVDHPLVVGPRYVPNVKPFCVTCYKIENLKPCSRRCRLPVCSQECEDNPDHVSECILFGNMFTTGEDADESNWDTDRFKTLTVIRCLKFDKLAMEIVANLHKMRSRVRNEVDLLRKIAKINLKPEAENFMRLCCRVLDGNAFEVRLPKCEGIGEEVFLRGLYPTASLMNHSCVPNATHHFNDDCQMIVTASNVILPGCEITSTYSPLLLGTAARRNFLAMSKEFYCTCLRCKDPSEFETYLTALKCRNTTCQAALLPVKPLDFNSEWRCVKCKSILTADKVAILQKAIIGELSRYDTNEPRQIIEFIRNEKFASSTNHTIIQFKYLLLKLLGYAREYEYSELSADLLEFKKQICEEILTIVKKLSLGQCEIKAVCLFELAMTNRKIRARKKEDDHFPSDVAENN